MDLDHSHLREECGIVLDHNCLNLQRRRGVINQTPRATLSKRGSAREMHFRGNTPLRARMSGDYTSRRKYIERGAHAAGINARVKLLFAKTAAAAWRGRICYKPVVLYSSVTAPN